MTLRFCYRVSEKVGVAQDEEGNNVEAYICAKARDIKSYNIPSKQYKAMQEGMRKMLAGHMGCTVDMLTPITLNEYLDNTEETEGGDN